MIGIIAIAYCLSITEGLNIEKSKPVEIKKHGAMAISYFRRGFDSIQNTVHNLVDLIFFVLKIIKPLKLLEVDLKTV
jgi:hypothetical protein